MAVVAFFCFIGHTNGDWTSGTFSANELSDFLNTVNNKRRAIVPEATTMKKLVSLKFLLKVSSDYCFNSLSKSIITVFFTEVEL